MGNHRFRLVALVLLCSGCGSQAPPPVATPATAAGAPSDDIEAIAATYRRLELMTKHAVASDVPTFCRVWTVDYVTGTQGPHADGLIKVYMNDLAKEAFEESTRLYPEGAVIVKEKLSHTETGENTEPHLEMTGLGGMIKRATGYDPERGDWEYFYADGATELQSGRIGNCVDCHTNASANDYVFGTWALEK